jgi:hypothetical protein
MAKSNPSLTSMTPHAPGERNFVNIHRDNVLDADKDKLVNKGDDGISGKSASAKVKVFDRKKFHFGNDEDASIAGYDPKAHKIGEAVHIRSTKRTLGKKRAFIDEVPKSKKPHVKEELTEAMRKDQLDSAEEFHTKKMHKKMDQQMWGKDDPNDPDRTGEISFHSAMRAWAARQRVDGSHIHDTNDMKRLSKFSKEMQKRGREKAAFKENFIGMLRSEAWSSDYETPKSKRGMFKGHSLSSLEAEDKHVSGKKKQQVDFAIRAKTGWGKVKEGEVIDMTKNPKFKQKKPLSDLNRMNLKPQAQTDFSRRMGYEFPKPKAVAENDTLPWLRTIADKKAALSENCIQTSDKDFLTEKVAFVKKTILAEGWKYLQYRNHEEAVAARKEHFTNKPSNSCRLLPDGKLAHKGDFGGPKPTGKK